MQNKINIFEKRVFLEISTFKVIYSLSITEVMGPTIN